MPRRPTGASPGDTLPAACAHTHLFPGGRCLVRLPAGAGDFVSDPYPLGLALRFGDGVAADAEILVADGGSAVLTVSAYTTGAGTDIPENAWHVRRFRQDGEEVELTVGDRWDRNARRTD